MTFFSLFFSFLRIIKRKNHGGIQIREKFGTFYFQKWPSQFKIDLQKVSIVKYLQKSFQMTLFQIGLVTENIYVDFNLTIM